MIHHLAQVDSSAQIADSAYVMNHAYIGPNVIIGPRCVIKPFAVVEQNTTMGADNIIHSQAVIGSDPQDVGYQGEQTHLVIGANNQFREGVTVNRGSHKSSKRTTVIGDHNYLMTVSHVGHDSVVGNHVVLTNGSALAGHVQVDDHVVLSAYCAVHQFCHIGAYAMVARGAMVVMDVLPFVMVTGGSRPHVNGINSRGLKNNGFTSEQIRAIKSAYKLVFQQGNTLAAAKAELEQQQGDEHITMLLAAITRARRGILR